MHAILCPVATNCGGACCFRHGAGNAPRSATVEEGTMKKLSTSPAGKTKKTEGKKRRSPFTPYREKGKGKEIGHELRAHVYRARAHARGVSVKQCIAAAVADAMKAFFGSPNDERIWARIAWRVGHGRFLDAVQQTIAEVREHSSPVPNTDLPRYFQSVLNRRFPKDGGAR